MIAAPCSASTTGPGGAARATARSSSIWSAVDLLPDREAATLATWLHHHPGAEIAARDRAGAYADGVRRGAPQSVQVADRFHLHCNGSEVLLQVVERRHTAFSRLAKSSR